MTDRRWEQLQKIFREALTKETHSRQAFLDQACSGDEELKSRIESLLDADRSMRESATPTQHSGFAGQILEPVRISERVGGGGMGVVYRGRHLNLDVDVAVKILYPELVTRSPTFVTRFQREAQLAATLNHPNLIRIYDVCVQQGLYYIVMEYVPGETANQLVGRLNPLRLKTVLAIITSATRGLAAAHRVGIVHRDVKPDNILISKQGAIKLADLGLAKIAEDDNQLTEPDQIVGTPHFMSPEQCRGAPDARGAQSLPWRSVECVFTVLSLRLPTSIAPRESNQRTGLSPYQAPLTVVTRNI